MSYEKYKEILEKIEDKYIDIKRNIKSKFYTPDPYDMKLRNKIKKSIKKLRKRPYYDADALMFHFMFESLVEFIEIELAIRNLDEEFENTYKWYHQYLGIEYRNPEAGLAYLDWEINMIAEEELDEWNTDLIVSQSKSALKKKELYFWYKYDWPKLSSTSKLLDNYKIEIEKLKELVDVMEGMWT